MQIDRPLRAGAESSPKPRPAGALCPRAALGPLLLLAAGAAGAAELPAEMSIIAPLASQSLLLDVSCVDDLWVAVGERGHVLVSGDGGASWRQVSVPTRATLTGVYFHDRRRGWAVGHDAVILRTEDGGESWQRVYADAEALRPLLDVRFVDEARGFAVGAYGYFLVSNDGGASWHERELTAERLAGEPAAAGAPTAEGDADEEWYALEEYDFSEGIGIHLNAIGSAADGRLFLAAESGALFRSDDDGETWVSLPSPYDGSFFGLLPLDGDGLLVFGLRGHLFRSDDGGASWRQLDSHSEAMLTDGLRLDDGRIVLVGLAGTVLLSNDGGQSFELYQQPDRDGLQALVQAGGERLVVVGEAGLRSLDAARLGAAESR